MDVMFYEYRVSYPSGTKLKGYAMTWMGKTKEEVRSKIEERLLGNYRLVVKKYGTEFPPINSDCIMDADR